MKYIYGPPLILFALTINGYILKGMSIFGYKTGIPFFGSFAGLLSDIFLFPLYFIFRLFGYQLEFIVF